MMQNHYGGRKDQEVSELGYQVSFKYQLPEEYGKTGGVFRGYFCEEKILFPKLLLFILSLRFFHLSPSGQDKYSNKGDSINININLG